MPELIDRQAAFEIAMCYCPDDDGCCSKAGHDIREMLDEIEALPAIKPEERRGRWVIKRNEFYTAYAMYYAECSNCKHTESTGMVERLKFCPNCGADMRGVSEDA